jgi:PIN domain nuclease of toxin-antitoxin system
MTTRINAIKLVYGTVNMKKQAYIELKKNGVTIEVITAWNISNYPTIDKLEANFSDTQIDSLYSESDINAA